MWVSMREYRWVSGRAPWSGGLGADYACAGEFGFLSTVVLAKYGTRHKTEECLCGDQIHYRGIRRHLRENVECRWRRTRLRNHALYPDFAGWWYSDHNSGTLSAILRIAKVPCYIGPTYARPKGRGLKFRPGEREVEEILWFPEVLSSAIRYANFSEMRRYECACYFQALLYLPEDLRRALISFADLLKKLPPDEREPLLWEVSHDLMRQARMRDGAWKVPDRVDLVGDPIR